MRIILQIIIVVIAFMAVAYLLRGRTSHMGKALKKVGFIVLILAMVVTVFFPGITDFFAELLGVKDGGSLFIYVLTLSFIIYALNNYLSQQDDRDKILQLARRIAVVEATERYSDKIEIEK